MVSLVKDKTNEISALCRMHKVKSFALFGSGARDEMTAESDLDFLVEFSPEIQVLDYADNYFSFLEALEALMGKRIELVSLHAIRNPVFKSEIDRTKVDLYAA